MLVMIVIRGQEYCPLYRSRPKTPDLKPAAIDRRGTRRKPAILNFFLFLA